jgi:hypothetical protein
VKKLDERSDRHYLKMLKLQLHRKLQLLQLQLLKRQRSLLPHLKEQEDQQQQP